MTASARTFGSPAHRRLLDEFVSLPVDALLRDRASRRPDETVLALFRDVAANVPAYRDYLEACGVDPSGVTSLDAFGQLPLVTKEDYVRRFPLATRCRHGRLDGCDQLAVSSGSTGEPTIWARALVDALRAIRSWRVRSSAKRACRRWCSTIRTRGSSR
jgi:phenylacetate-CoA ligase